MEEGFGGTEIDCLFCDLISILSIGQIHKGLRAPCW
jgi:hypothetical protein